MSELSVGDIILTSVLGDIIITSAICETFFYIENCMEYKDKDYAKKWVCGVYKSDLDFNNYFEIMGVDDV